MNMLRLALWQGAGVPGDLCATAAEAGRVIARAAEAGAGLVVFPEGYLTGYHIPGLAPGGLGPVDAALAQVGEAAASAGIALVMGTLIDAPEGLRNSAVILSSAGSEIGRYHKRALFGAWEKATFLPGDAPFRFECGGLNVGLAICYDVEFPEIVRAEAQAGVDLLVVPTALMAPHDNVARLLVPARAFENQIFLGYANRCGSEPGLDFVGLSSIRGPAGEALAETGAGPDLLLADLDRAALSRARSEASYLDDLAELRLP